MDEWTTTVCHAFIGLSMGCMLLQIFVDTWKMRLLRRYIEDPQTTDEEAVAILEEYGG